jgi:hypothetical protein
MIRSTHEILKGTRYNENQIEYFWAECYLDYPYFAKHVLGFDVAEYHEEWNELLEKSKRLCLIAFRGSGKTCFIAGYFIWKAIFSTKDLNFLILSFNFEQSKIVLKLIRRMIVENEILKNFVPETRELIWKATEITLKTGATFYCKTYGEGVRSLRIDYCLCDEAGQYEDKSIFWAAVSPVVQLNRGRIIVIGTKKSTADLLCELEDNEQYFSKEYPVEKDGIVLWPQRYTFEEEDTETQRSIPQIKKELGLLSFNQEYLLIPISSANSLFPYELCSQGLSNEVFMSNGIFSKKYYLGYDIANSPKGDYVVMVVLEVDASKKKIVRAYRFRDNFEEQKRKIREIYANFPIKKGIADANCIGDGQAKELHIEFPNLEPMKTSYEIKYKMMMDMRNEFDNFSIVIPNGKDQNTKEIIDMNAYGFSEELLKELNEFSLKIDLRPGETTRPKFHKGKYDDCCDALAMAIHASKEVYGEVSIRGLE